jgi:hypothetical protein
MLVFHRAFAPSATNRFGKTLTFAAFPPIDRKARRDSARRDPEISPLLPLNFFVFSASFAG